MTQGTVPSYMSNLGLDSFGNAGAPTGGMSIPQQTNTQGGSSIPMAGLGANMSDQKKMMMLQLLMKGIGGGGIPQGGQMPNMQGALGGGVAGSI